MWTLMMHGYIRQGGHSQEHSVWWWIGKLQCIMVSPNIEKTTGGLMKVKFEPRQVENWVRILCTAGNNNIRKDLGFKSFVHWVCIDTSAPHEALVYNKQKKHNLFPYNIQSSRVYKLPVWISISKKHLLKYFLCPESANSK